MTQPAVRRQDAFVPISKEEFRRRFFARFYDPAFESVTAELENLVAWDANASAERCFPVLAAGEARERQVEAVRIVGERLTWDRTAQRLLGVYGEALGLGRGDDGWASLEAEALRGQWEGRYWKLFNDAGPSGLALVGPDGLLPEPARRALAALAARPLTRRPLLAALGLVARHGSDK